MKLNSISGINSTNGFLNTLVEKYVKSSKWNNYVAEKGGDKNEAMEDFEWYVTELSKLNEKGGTIYRLIFVSGESKINRENLGNHFCLNKNTISNFFNTLESHADRTEEEETLSPWLIEYLVEPNCIDMDESIDNYLTLPNECEVNLTTQKGRIVNLSPYSRI